MNQHFLNIIRLQLQKAFARTDKQALSRYMAAKRAKQERKKILHVARDITFLLAGVLSAGFGLKGFLIPNDFIDGGVMGISLLIHRKQILHSHFSSLSSIFHLSSLPGNR